MYCGLMSMGLSSIINSKERKGEKKRKIEKRREKKRQICSGSIIINLHSILKKKKLNILAEMLKISKSGLAADVV